MNRPITFQNTAPYDMPSVMFDTADELIAAEKLDDLLRDPNEMAWTFSDYVDVDISSSILVAMYQAYEMKNDDSLLAMAKSLMSFVKEAGEKRLEQI